MKVVVIPPSTAKVSYRDEEKMNEIKAFFESADLKAGDIVKYSVEYPFNLLRREAENFRFDIYYCAPGTPEFEEHGAYTFLVKDRMYKTSNGPFRELTTQEHFESLKHGDSIHRVVGTSSRGLRVVGRMPGSNVYLILSDGEHLEHLYIPNHISEGLSETDKSMHLGRSMRWFTGKYDSKIVGKVMLENNKHKAESIKRIYIKDED
jgi:hypothetical protein